MFFFLQIYKFQLDVNKLFNQNINSNNSISLVFKIKESEFFSRLFFQTKRQNSKNRKTANKKKMRPRDSNTSVSTRRSLSHSPQRQFKSLKEQDSFLQQDSSFSNSNAFSGDKENLSMSIPSKQILESPGIQNSATKK